MKKLSLTLLVLLCLTTAPLTVSSARAQTAAAATTTQDGATTKTKVCKKGKLCGHSCIPQKATCSLDKASGDTSSDSKTSDTKTAPVAPAPPAASSSSPSTSATHKAPKHCVKGKACGNTCIAKTDTCHIPE